MSKDTASPLDENTRRYYLDVMGIQCWESLDNAVGHDIDINQKSGEHGASFQQFETDVQQCVKCQLHTKRKQAIAGRGNQSAELMFVLLSPDSNDDESGILCSGGAGDLFAKMLSAINISIDDVYITSLLKCNVPALHTVSTSELYHCKNYLKQQIALVQPKLLIVLGETAARCLLQKDFSLDDLRELVNTGVASERLSSAAGAVHQFESVPLFVSYSPQELAILPDNKRKAWLDLQQIQKIIEV